LPVKGSSRYATPAIVVLAGLLWLYRDVLWSLARHWASDDDYSYGFLIIPVAIYCAWERRDLLSRLEPRPHPAGFVLVLLSLLMFAMGVFGAELFLGRISLVGAIIGAILFVWGSAHVRALAFPLALLPLMVPLPTIVFNQITLPLQLVASRVGESAIAAAGIPVLREGNILELPNMTIAVAEACSGIRSLMSLLTVAIVVAYFMGRTTGGRLAVVMSAVPIAIAANAIRVAGTGMAAHWVGRRAAEGFFHGFSGWMMFVVAFAALIGVQAVVNRTGVGRWHRPTLEERCSVAH
jgi:exosortase